MRLGPVADMQVDGAVLPVSRERVVLNLSPHPVDLYELLARPDNPESERP